MRILMALILKEFRLLKRNPFIPKIVIIFPFAIILLVPWITNMDVKDINVAVVDYDHSDVSRKLISRIDASEYLHLQNVFSKYQEALSHLEEGSVDAILEIPVDYGRDMLHSPGKLAIWANGVNAMKGSLGSQYLMQTVSQSINDMTAERGMQAQQPQIEVTNLYNQILDYKHFMIPALMVMIFVMIAGFIPALNLVIEKETGTIEQINVTPVNRFTFTLSKLIPFWLFCFLDLAICMALAYVIYGLPVAGSIGAIVLAVALFIIVMSSLGVIIANLSDTMQQTMFVMLFVVLFFILVSGLMTPVASMPVWAQYMAWSIPPTYMMEIMRDIYLKGTTISELWMDYTVLAGFAAVMPVLAALIYKKRN